jgi:hypothetical protein
MSNHQLLAAIFGLLAFWLIQRDDSETPMTKGVATVVILALVAYTMAKG